MHALRGTSPAALRSGRCHQATHHAPLRPMPACCHHSHFDPVAGHPRRFVALLGYQGRHLGRSVSFCGIASKRAAARHADSRRAARIARVLRGVQCRDRTRPRTSAHDLHSPPCPAAATLTMPTTRPTRPSRCAGGLHAIGHRQASCLGTTRLRVAAAYFAASPPAHRPLNISATPYTQNWEAAQASYKAIPVTTRTRLIDHVTGSL